MRGFLSVLTFSLVITLAGAGRRTQAEEPLTAVKGCLDPEQLAASGPGPLEPVSFTEGSGYVWRGVFRIEGEGEKKAVYLCHRKDRAKRIRLSPTWADHVLREWRWYEGHEVEGNSWSKAAPLQFYLLRNPEKLPN
jgi:hypothetical protein